MPRTCQSVRTVPSLSGFSLIEVVVAVAIFAIGMVSVVGLFAPVARSVAASSDAEAAARVAEAVRTPDENPLRFQDIRRFEPYFRDVSHREFWLTSLAIFGKFFLIDRAHPSKERYWKKVITDADANAWWFRQLPEIDEVILKRLPFLSAMCWNTVIRVANPRIG